MIKLSKENHMNKLINLTVAAATLATLALPLAASAVTAAPVAGCPGTYTKVVHLPWGAYYNSTTSNTAILAAGGASIRVTGNNDCVLSGDGSSVTVKGNNNFVEGARAYMVAIGTGNTITSDGGSFVNGGGGTCNVDYYSDYAINCI
jgi:hypothetical protein